MKKVIGVAAVFAALLVGALLFSARSPAQAAGPLITMNRWPPRAEELVSQVVAGLNVVSGSRTTLMTVPSDKFLVITAVEFTNLGSSTNAYLRLREVLNGTDTQKSLWGQSYFQFYGFDGSDVVFQPGSDVVLDNTPPPVYAPAAFIGDVRLVGYLSRK